MAGRWPACGRPSGRTAMLAILDQLRAWLRTIPVAARGGLFHSASTSTASETINLDRAAWKYAVSSPGRGWRESG